MNRPDVSPEVNYDVQTTVLDIYFAETAKGPEYCTDIVMELWNALPPDDRLTMQSAAYAASGNDLKLGAAYTRSLLLFEHANRIAIGNTERS